MAADPSTPLERLAARLRRPQQAFSGLSALTQDELLRLDAAIDAACARQHAQTEQALRRIPLPLRRLVMGRGRADLRR